MSHGKADGWKRAQRVGVHLLRVLLFAVIILLVHWKHQQVVSRQPTEPFAAVDRELLNRWFPSEVTLATETGAHGGRDLLDETGVVVGYLLQTSPASDNIIGFSGSTNVLLGFNSQDEILGVAILSSGDTRDHLKTIKASPHFFQQYQNQTWEQAAGKLNVDTVSGATLTSLAIHEGILRRLNKGKPLPESLRFPAPLSVELAKKLFPEAATVSQSKKDPALWSVENSSGKQLGTLLRTVPAADQLIGYQGPTETWIGFDPAQKVVGITLGKTFDNEEYVTYVREELYFLEFFNDLTLNELAKLNLVEAQVEGVSGATMTSMAVADGLLQAAQSHQEILNKPEPVPLQEPTLTFSPHDYGTVTMIVLAFLIGLTSLRGNKWVRLLFLLVLVGYLGAMNGDMLSQAMLFGWAKSGVPWKTAPGLVLLTIAALLLPITTRRNLYCTHLCPHGAAQQLLKNRLPWRITLPKWATILLKLIPPTLLGICLVVVMLQLSFSLVDLEPFDAWFIRVAGWATLTIAVVGLVASLFVPMAYCRFGCPTGALLSYLRFHGRSEEWTTRDWLALSLTAMTTGLFFW